MTSSNMQGLIQNAESVEITAGKAACRVNVEAHIGGSRCAKSSQLNRVKCGSSGGCVIGGWLDLEKHPGIALIFFGGFIVLLIALREAYKFRKNERASRQKKDDNPETRS